MVVGDVYRGRSLYKIKTGVASTSNGFALPTVLIASSVMLLVLTVGMTSVVGVIASLRQSTINRYVSQALESGTNMAKACLQQSGGVVTWSSANPLRPNSNCSGGPMCTDGTSCYINAQNGLRSSFVVTDATRDYNSTFRVTVQGFVEAVRTSTNQSYRTYSSNAKIIIALREYPTISGGAGWADAGHIGVVLTQSNDLYGFGSNDSSQLYSPASATVPTPTRLSLPAGVATVKKVVTSGLGATYQCIIGSDDQAYCRGKPGANEASFNTTTDWNKVSGWPSNYRVYDAIINGYGADAACFRVGLASTTTDVYCIGSARLGQLGNGSTDNDAYYTAANAQRFQLPAGVYARKVAAMNDQVCALTYGDDLYCSGWNNGGQITGNAAAHTSPIKYNMPNGRKVRDVIIAGYHDAPGESVRVLATDGTIWSSGWNPYGAFGTGTSGTNTFDAQSPVLFGGFGVSGGTTGDRIQTKNLGSKCIDNSGWLSTSGNPVVIWDCGPSDNQGQRWVYKQSTHEIVNVSAGKCLDIPNAAIQNGSLLRIWDCNASAAQQFSFQANGSITVDGNPAFCIDIPSSTAVNGTQLQIRNCDNADTELFTPGANLNGWQAMVSGDTFFCAIRDQIGTGSGMWCAGGNNYGQLGNIGSNLGGGVTGSACVDSSIPLQVQLPPGETADWTRMSSEWAYQVGSIQLLTRSGKIYGSGQNSYGKLGSGMLGDASQNYRTCQLQQMQIPNSVRAIAMSTRDPYTTYFIGTDANVYATGRNNNGQLGNGTTIDSLVPTGVLLPTQKIIIY